MKKLKRLVGVLSAAVFLGACGRTSTDITENTKPDTKTVTADNAASADAASGSEAKEETEPVFADLKHRAFKVKGTNVILGKTPFREVIDTGIEFFNESAEKLDSVIEPQQSEIFYTAIGLRCRGCSVLSITRISR